ncbi:MAG: hypothetical protein R6W71_12295 [Bacteroidales bacterium]
MKKELLEKIIEKCLFPDSCEKVSRLIETHISWVVLTDNYAFKIKRPVKFSFLDFSSFEKRKYYCERELELNRRLSPEMYLDVIPITDGESDGSGDRIVLDHAVKMKRMDNDREMERLLRKNEVTGADLKKLAAKIAAFHKEAELVKDPFDTNGFQQKYADILLAQDFIQKHFGGDRQESIQKCVKQSNTYLNSNRDFLNERITNGYRRDVHGDLKAANIFLYDDPVIFDCIEFNDDYRYLDLLNDVAFICVDIDFYGSGDSSEFFFQHYLQSLDMHDNPESRELLNYYKSYRANVKAKVTILKNRHKNDMPEYLEDVQRSLELMEYYISDFQESIV